MSNTTSAEMAGRHSGIAFSTAVIMVSVSAAGVGTLAWSYFPSIFAAAVVAPAVVGLTWWLLKSPVRCMYALVIALPLEATAVLEVGFTLRIAYALMGLCCVSTWLARRRLVIERDSTTPALMLFVLICTASMVQLVIFPPPEIVNLQSSLGLRASGLRVFVQLFLLLLHVAFFFNVLVLLRDKAQIQTAVRLYAVTAVVVAAYGVYQLVAITYDLPLKNITNAISTGGEGIAGIPYASSLFAAIRPRSTFQEPANLGLFLLSALAILLIYQPFAGPRRRFTQYSSILVLVWGIIVTVSRGTYLGLLLILVLLLVTGWSRKTSPHTLVVVLLSIAAFAAVVFPVMAVMSHGASSMTGMLAGRFVGSEMANEARREYLPVLLAVWQKHPILGVGLGAYGAYGAAELQTPTMMSAHGVWWSVLVETGLLGLVTYMWFVGAWFKQVYRRSFLGADRELRALLAGLVLAMAGVTFEFLFMCDRMPTYVWFLLALGCSASNLSVRNSGADRPALGVDQR